MQTGMETETPPIRPTDLAEKLGISVPYASQLLSGARPPSLPLALDYFAKSGVKLGPLVSKTDEQIEILRQALAA
jgi:transcriptional regulator with XRE-family HTH domain